MAVCAVCGGEMLGVDSCRQEPVNFPDGASLSPIAYGHERRITWESARCHDCGVARGGYHHPGCDVEECPRCHGQIISCGCTEDPERR